MFGFALVQPWMFGFALVQQELLSFKARQGRLNSSHPRTLFKLEMFCCLAEKWK